MKQAKLDSPGALARGRHAAGDADQVRFGDADVEETLGKLLGEVVRARRVVDVAVEDDDVRILLAELRQRQAEGLAG